MSETNDRNNDRPGDREENPEPEGSEEVREDVEPGPDDGREDPAEDIGVFDADIVEDTGSADSSADGFADGSVEDGISPEDSPEVVGLRAELEEAVRERDEYLDAMRRLKAEFENSRKRQERERERILQSASERLILSLLPVLDNLDRALQSDGDVREGVKATREQLADAMTKEGLLPVTSDGEHFDPNLHEAVMSQSSDDHEEGVVIQTFERGYTLNGRPIRPAKVVVSQ